MKFFQRRHGLRWQSGSGDTAVHDAPGRAAVAGRVSTRPLQFILAITVLLFAFVAGHCADTSLIGHATDFVSNQYFEPPNQQKVKVRVSGTSATPTADNRGMSITDLRIERFKVTGETEAIVTAPQCTYSFDGVASSAGHLEFQSGDGKMKTSGDGFLWRQSDNSLTISNHVHTVLMTKAFRLTMP